MKYRPKFAGRNSRNASFKYSSSKLINWVNPSGSLGPNGLMEASTTVRHLHDFMLSGICKMWFLLIFSSCNLVSDETADGMDCNSLSDIFSRSKPSQWNNAWKGHPLVKNYSIEWLVMTDSGQISDLIRVQTELFESSFVWKDIIWNVFETVMAKVKCRHVISFWTETEGWTATTTASIKQTHQSIASINQIIK